MTLDLLKQLIKHKRAYNPSRGKVQELGDVTFVFTTTADGSVSESPYLGDILNFIPIIKFPDVWYAQIELNEILFVRYGRLKDVYCTS